MRFFIVAAVVGTAIATNGSKECANKCTTKWEACKAALNANQSFCSSDYTSCLGFSPFSNGYIKPTACSSSTAEPTSTICFDCSAPTAEPTSTICFDCSAPTVKPTSTICFDCSAPTAEPTSTICFDCSAPTAEPTSTICFDCSAPTAEPTSTICFDCSAPTVKPTSTTCFDCSTPPLQPAQDPCAKKCTDLWVACKTTPNANQSFCSAQYASCLGFTPFKDSFSVPTACITTSVIASTSKPTTTICYDCVGGYPNGTTNNPYPSFTAAAGRVEPAILIAVFCAAALL
ncbi:uncharacterized protein TRIVIDRAFT_222486 [Trichoderma virens Gv29-8]|uniref:Uncharacterized protein n=1 Tax=Hypocrea virens (strain Gv29-8 / FGSC 10586) TaxID=413071 RepID=G9MU14_HYPVG|nr:uncharacterized protein TRIVIDRAFT_222486 [Trichoderma virens Gv29-8]EHK22066.1 hypothetical protein TRIVIDRAFT_222486 [Trichoderma virens Gv29-8]UKZ54385.1 hypothetical protein TrVGV298_008193 [Trichoderma virens]